MRPGREVANCCATIPPRESPHTWACSTLQEIKQVNDRVGKTRYGVRADGFGQVAVRWEVGGNYLIGLAEFGDLITPHSPADKGAVYQQEQVSCSGCLVG